MGKSKRLQSPHRKNSTTKNIQNKSVQRRRSLLTLVSPDDVNEGTLQIWRSLPSKIRQDPSLAPFQLENERVHGMNFRNIQVNMHWCGKWFMNFKYIHFIYRLNTNRYGCK